MHIFGTKDQEPSNVKRKFMAEAGTNLFSGGATVFRPYDLYKYGKEPFVRDAMEGCNIYLVCRRRRITVCPYTLRVSDGKLYGEFRLHGDGPGSYDPVKFSQKKNFLGPDGTPLRFTEAVTTNTYGQEIRALDPRMGGTITIPAHGLIAHAKHSVGTHTDLEVLYIGQAYGKDGKRLAIDRLSDHSTLQRILAESAEENPADEILLLMFRYEHYKHIASSAGDFSVEPSASSEEEIAHLKSIPDVRLSRKARISLAEAALINHFKPKYNVMHKESFNPRNNKKLKTLKPLLDLDLSALIVEINTSNLDSKIFSSHAPAKNIEKIFDADTIARMKSAKWCQDNGLSLEDMEQFVADHTHIHVAEVPLYSETERETFLHGLPWKK
jgi:hypothetical protein